MLGHLYSPGGEAGPFPFMPYALDNGAFPAWTNGRAWEPQPWLDLLGWARQSGQRPLWVLVPDVVGDRAATIAAWHRWAPVAAAYGWPLAFAAQDGMSFDDVPADAAVVFLGGSTEWKWASVSAWCARFPRVHVGRVNTYRWLRVCEDAGAESVDGTGWFRGRNAQVEGLKQWLREASGESARTIQTSLSFDDSGDPTAPGSRSSSTAEPAACGDGSTAGPRGEA